MDSTGKELIAVAHHELARMHAMRVVVTAVENRIAECIDSKHLRCTSVLAVAAAALPLRRATGG
jgi:hypothetical protein